MNWPPNSPDINEIEPVWDYMKDELASFETDNARKETVIVVKEAMKAIWEGISQEYINRRFLDFKNKLELVIENWGMNNFNA